MVLVRLLQIGAKDLTVFVTPTDIKNEMTQYFVNPSKRGRSDGVFRGLARLLREIF